MQLWAQFAARSTVQRRYSDEAVVGLHGRNVRAFSVPSVRRGQAGDGSFAPRKLSPPRLSCRRTEGFLATAQREGASPDRSRSTARRSQRPPESWSSGQSVTARSAASRIDRASIAVRDSVMPLTGHSHTKASGPDGGSGQTHCSMSQIWPPPPPPPWVSTGGASSSPLVKGVGQGWSPCCRRRTARRSAGTRQGVASEGS